MVKDVPVWSGSERCDRHLFCPSFVREAGPTWIRSAGTEFSIRAVVTIRSTRATCIDAHFEQHSFVRNETTSWRFRAGARVCTPSCRPFRRVASFVRLLFVSDPRRSTSTRSCERGASRTTSAWTRGCASSCDSSELDRDRGQTRFDRGMGWEPGFLSNPDFLRFEPEIVSNQPSVSQPDPSDKVRGSSCQISHVASPPLSRLKPFLSCGVIILRCVVSETRGVRPPPDSGARRSEREREGERHTEREGGESESRIYRGGTVGVWTTIRTTRAANTHLRAANRPCDAACV